MKINKQIISYFLLAAVLILPDLAFAQSAGANSIDGGFFCVVAQNVKRICGVAGFVAVAFWAVEHMLGASQLHKIVISVGIGAAIISIAALGINVSGLSANCAF